MPGVSRAIPTAGRVSATPGDRHAVAVSSPPDTVPAVRHVTNSERIPRMTRKRQDGCRTSTNIVSMAGVGDPIESALEHISSFDVAELPSSDMPVAGRPVEQLLNVVHALSAELLERFERDGDWAAEGALSAAAWTAQRSGSARAGLRRRRRQGAALSQLPAVAAAARTGAPVDGAPPGRARPGLCVPKLRPAAVMDRYPALHPMERRRHHIGRQRRPSL